ncbi:MAG: hypothetical protein KC912_19685 [Proteobacteria bacterium]|nr:hypothetical protein [Pseudomonadota bacterium]
MPHFVLGVWKGRILSAFGMSPSANIAYGLTCFCISIGLFWYQNGIAAVLENGIYAGALAILITYFITGRFFYRLFRLPDEEESPRKGSNSE